MQKIHILPLTTKELRRTMSHRALPSKQGKPRPLRLRDEMPYIPPSLRWLPQGRGFTALPGKIEQHYPV